MSEFTCRCGEMMIRVHDVLTCPVCGGKHAAYMDGMSNTSSRREQRCEDQRDAERENETDDDETENDDDNDKYDEYVDYDEYDDDTTGLDSDDDETEDDDD